jgi:hypothetical protein
MGMEIGRDPIKRREIERAKHQTNQGTQNAERTKEAELKAMQANSLKSEIMRAQQLHEAPLKQSLKMDRPLLHEHTSRFERMSDAIINVQKELALPSSKDLIDLLSPQTKKNVNEAIEDNLFTPSNGLKIQNFFDILSRLIPLGISLLHGLASDEHVVNLSQMREAMLNTLKETGELMSKHGESLQLSEEGKQLLSLISEKLTTLPTGSTQTQDLNEQLRAILGHTLTPNSSLVSYGSVKHFTHAITKALGQGKTSVSVAAHQQLIGELVDADLLPPSAFDQETISRESLTEIKTQLENFQNNSVNRELALDIQGKPMAPTIGFLANFLSNIGVFPERTQSEVIKVMISTQPVLSYTLSNRALGPHTVHFAHSLSHFAVDLSQQMGLIPSHPAHLKSVSEYFTRIFAGLIITAGILGRLEVDRGDGKAMTLEDAKETGKAQRQSAQELELHDLPPFSFFALWAPFSDLDRDSAKEHKKAAKALSELMRVLLRLVYLLVAIYTGGKKLGEGGTDLLLDENSVYLTICLDDFIFSLKKIDELFGVRIIHTMERCHAAKDALLKKDHPEFWHHIFQAIQEKSDVKDFLEEVDQVDSLYSTIRTLISGSGFDTSVVRM